MAPTKKPTPPVPSLSSLPNSQSIQPVVPVELKQPPKKNATTKTTDDKSIIDGKVPKVTIVTPVESIDPIDVVQMPVNADGTPIKDNLVGTIIEKVNTLFTNFKEVQSLLKVLSKEYDKQQKIIEKAQKKRQNAKNSPSGFAKPNKISDELCDFIGVPHGTEKSRTDITRFINTYVKEHNLNKPENKRFILPDEKLKKILNVGDKEDINYFILQKLISHHFPLSASKQAQASLA